MTAQVTIELESRKNVLLLPLSALGNEISPQTYEVDILQGNKVEKNTLKLVVEMMCMWKLPKA